MPPASWANYVYLKINLSLLVYIALEKPQWGVVNYEYIFFKILTKEKKEKYTYVYTAVNLSTSRNQRQHSSRCLFYFFTIFPFLF